MMTNPVRSSALFDLPLTQEICQQMHAAAFLRTAHGRERDLVPSSVPAPQLRERRQRFGPEICLVHPAEIEQIFRGVTCSLYQWIEQLYCAPLARSIEMVTRIVNAVQQRAQQPAIHEEAVWALCLSLEERRLQHTRVTTQQSDATWWIGEISSAVPATPEHAHTSQKAQQILVGVIELSAPHVLAFQIGERGVREELFLRSLYDALIGTRHPDPQGAGGLVWRVPDRLVTTDTLPMAGTAACLLLGMSIEGGSAPVPLTQHLQQIWTHLQTRLMLTPHGQAIAFDSALNRAYGTSPLRTRERADHQFGHLTGYRRDPASLVVALRALLPHQQTAISQEGEIFSDGLHYTDDLLSCFAGSDVLVQRSVLTEAAIWVTLDGEILCQAMARELARRDGSYRSHRPGR